MEAGWLLTADWTRRRAVGVRRRPTARSHVGVAASVIVAYLVAGAVVVVGHGVLAMPGWLALHLLVVGAASNAARLSGRLRIHHDPPARRRQCGALGSLAAHP